MRQHSVVLLVLAFTAAAAMAFGHPAARWRVKVLALRVLGDIPDLSWTETLRFMKPGSAVYLQPLATNPNPFESIENSRNSPEDVSTGRELFAAHCAECHGPDASGRSGPDLTLGNFRHGASDWALFRSISRGIPETAMGRHNLPPIAVWQIIGFLRDAMASRSIGATPLTPTFSVTFDAVVAAGEDSTQWLTYSGSLNGHRHSRLAQVRRDNVNRLRLRWMYQFESNEPVVEVTPLVVGNTMFVTLPPNSVWALDARTGDTIWRYSAPAAPLGDIPVTAGLVNRGLAVLGSTLYMATTDGHLLALNGQTGSRLWEVEVADYRMGYSLTSAPLAIDGKVIVGVAGGERGIRGFLDAYSAESGQRIWRFNSIPAPGEPGTETWGPESLKRGGGPMWLTGSYDPELDLVYWGIGNPAPDFNGDARPGDNLYTNSVVALDSATGRLRWYFQFTPHDTHDWDAAQIPILADSIYQGIPRKLMYWANRNGFYYVLDRATGKFLTATAFARQNWAHGIDATGRPQEILSTRPTPEGVLVYPSMDGATNWWSPSYDSAAGLMFVPTMENGSVFFKGDAEQDEAGDLFIASHRASEPGAEPAWTAIRALEANTGQLRWEYRFPPRRPSIVMGGVLSTDGKVVFGGDANRFVALDAETGKELWQFNTGGRVGAAPITYLSEGTQNIAIVAGRSLLVFSLDGR